MTSEEAIKQLKPLAEYFDTHVPAMGGEAIRLAIAALRAQHTPTKLDRSRWEGCEWCTKARPLKARLGLGYQYCEHCGRPITEEAWVEQERRIGGNGETIDKAD